MEIKLRPYQEEAIQQLRIGLSSGHKNQLLCAPTGAGKTVIASNIVDSSRRKGKRCAFIVDRNVLVDQTSEVFATYGIPHGIIQADHPLYRPYEKVQIISAQTMERRKGIMDDFDLIIVDECHTVRKATTEILMQRNCPAIGLTATPFSKGLGRIYDNLVNVTTTNSLIEENFLSDYSVYSCPEPDMTGVKIAKDGEWAVGEASGRSIDVVGDVVKTYLDKAFGRKFICSAVDTKHVEALKAQFQEAGIMCASFTYRTTPEERREIVTEFRKPDSFIRGLITVSAATKGFDCLSEDTEILTPDGWKGIGQIEVGDSVYGFNRDTEKMEIVSVEAYGERPLNDGERMVSIKSQRFDIRVSEGHQFHYKYRTGKYGKRSDEYKTSTAAEMVERKQSSYLPTSAEYDFPGIQLTDDEIKLIAWFITDGSMNRQTFSITQSKHYKHEIHDLLNRLGLDFREYERPAPDSSYKNAKPITVFNIPKGTHSGLKRNGWKKYEAFLDKKVSRLLLNMTKHQFRVLWDELLKGNGAKQHGKSGWLWCPYKEQADAFTHMAVVRGYSANYMTQKTKMGKTMYVVSIRDAKYLMTAPTSPIGAKFVFEEPKPNEKVWCIKNSLSTIVTRRNGRVVILGNCPDVDCVIMARPLRKALAEHIQLLGRGLRPFPGKGKCIVLDHAGNCRRFWGEMLYFFANGASTLDEKEKKWQKAVQEEEKEERSVKCSNCDCLYKAKLPYCPECGMETPRAKTDIIHTEGELVKLQKEAFLSKIPAVEIQRQIKRYVMGRNSNKKESMYIAIYKTATGKFPKKKYWDVDPADHIDPGLMKIIIHNNIKYAKRRAAA